MHAVWRVESVVISGIMWNAPFWLHLITALMLRHSCVLPFEPSVLDHLKTCTLKKKLQFMTAYSSKYWPWSQDCGGISECDDVRVVCKVKNLFLTLSVLSLLTATLCVQLSATLWMPAWKYWMNPCAVYIIHHVSPLSCRSAMESTCKRYKHVTLRTNYSGFQQRWV